MNPSRLFHIFKKITKSIVPGILLIGTINSSKAQISIATDKDRAHTFQLASKNCVAPIYYDPYDAEVVKTASELLAADVEAVTGKKPALGTTSDAKDKQCIIAGTIGGSDLIKSLANSGKIDISSLEGGWERYIVQLVDNPLPGVKKALVIAGSDRRGTAYGLLLISRAIGISPWYWWLDAPVKRQDSIVLKVNNFISDEPSVKYRGIFINDEDWGLYQWAAKNFEKERGNIGPRTYEKVCELLLRLQANYLCPAMHNCSAAFHSIPENREVAHRYGIVTGSSHCEPLMLNTATEWHHDRYGAWDYMNNRATVDSVLDARAKELAPYENIYTLALRGLHDSAMSAGSDMRERMKLLQEALLSQRNMVVKHTGKPADMIPQAFTPYKEVLDVYDQGLELPEDVTIIWPDDNYGYMKRLSNPGEQKRSGRSGVYYHASYLGKPHDHLWMHTASPTVMYEELRKAYDQTADRIWLLNCGDIKSCEFAVDFFLTMAYDIDSFDFKRAADYRTEWLCSMLGNEHREKFADVCDTFYKLAFTRRPEFMGWGYEWSTDGHDRERTTDTDFSLDSYREVDNRIREYRRIADIAQFLLDYTENETDKACMYQALYYPVKGCELLNRMVLDGQRNRRYAAEGRASAANYAASAKECFDSLEIITKEYNSLLGGKWNHIMSMHQGITTSYYELPELRQPALKESASLGVKTEEDDALHPRCAYRMLPVFNTFYRRPYYVDIFNRGKKPLKWTSTVSDGWIITDKNQGDADETRMEVAIDWNKVPTGENLQGSIDIIADNGEMERIYISVFNPSLPSLSELDSLYVENNGYISIDAAGFHRKQENKDIKMTVAPYLGCENFAVQIGNPAAPQQRTAGRDVPRLEYDFFTFDQGSVDVYTYVLPTFTLNNDRGYAGHEATNAETKYGVCIDDGPVMNPSTSSVEYAQIWYESVLKNCRINKTTLHVGKPGKHTLKVICGDPGTVIQKIVIDFGGMKRSYMGPPPTRSNKMMQKDGV